MDFAEIIERVGDKVIEQDLSANAMSNITTLQVKAMGILPVDFVLTQAKFNKIKKRAVKRLRSHRRSKVRAAFNNRLSTWLNDNYPDATIYHREVGDNPVIEIWYEGKPTGDIENGD